MGTHSGVEPKSRKGRYRSPPEREQARRSIARADPKGWGAFQRRFTGSVPLRNIASLSGAGLVAPATAVLLSPLMARALGPDGRGIYSALTMPILVAGIAGTFGMQDAISRFIAARGLTNRDAIRACFRALPALFAVTFIVSYVLGRTIFASHKDILHTYALLLLCLPCQILYNLLIGVATGAGDLRSVARLRIGPVVVRAAAIVALIASDSMTPTRAAAALVLCPLPDILLIARRLVRSGPTEKDGTARSLITPAGSRNLIATSLACFPGLLASLSTARIDQIIGLPLIGARELGLYAVAVSIAEVGLIVATSTRQLILGIDINSPDARIKQRTLIRNAVIISALINGVLSIASVWIFPLAFGDSFRGAVAPCTLLCIGGVFYTIGITGAASLLMNGHAFEQSMAIVIGALVNVTMLVALSGLGAFGAACASLLGYGVTAALILFRLYLLLIFKRVTSCSPASARRA